MTENGSNKVHRKRNFFDFLLKTLRRPLPYVGLIGAILLMIFSRAIRDYTANLVGETIVTIVENETDGQYRVFSDAARYDIFTEELRIENFVIALDTTQTDRERHLRENSSIVEFETPLLVFKIHSLFDLVFKRDLRIDFIGILSPTVDLETSEHFQKIDIDSASLLTDFHKYLNTLEVDSFRIQEGEFKVFDHQDDHLVETDLHIQEFSLVLKNFKFDQKSNLDVFEGLYADHISLDIRDQQFIQLKSKDQIKFKRLHLNSMDSIFLIDSLKYIMAAEISDSAEYTGLGMNLDIPEVRLSGFNYEHAYKHNELHFDTLYISNPDVYIKPVKQENKNSERQNIAEYIGGAIASHIIIDDGRFAFGNHKELTTRKLNFHAQNINLDTLLLDPYNILNSTGDFDLGVQGIKLDLPDSIHTLTVEEINFNHEDSILGAHLIRINPKAGKGNYYAMRDANVPLLQRSSLRDLLVEGLDLSLLITDQKLDLGSITLTRPVTYLLEYPSIRSSRRYQERNTNNSLGLEAIGHLSISNGFFSYDRIQQGKRDRVAGSSIYLDANRISQGSIGQFNPGLKTLHYTNTQFENFNLNIDSLFVDLENFKHVGNFKNIQINDFRSISMQRADFEPDTVFYDQHRYQMSGRNILIKGFDEESLFRYNSLYIDSITVGRLSAGVQLADIVKTNTSQKESQSPVNQVIVGYFGIGDGNVNLSNKNLRTSVSNVFGEVYHFEVDSLQSVNNPKFNFFDIFLQYGRFSYTDKNSGFRAFGTSGQLSEKDSVIVLNNVSLRNKTNNFTSRIASMRLQGLDKKRLQVDRFIRFNNLDITRPTFKLAFSDEDGEPNDSLMVKMITEATLKNQILKNISGIDFNRVSVNNAKLDVTLKNGRMISLSGINSNIIDYNLDSLTAPIQLMQPGSFSLEIDDIVSNGSKDTIQVAGVLLDLNRNTLVSSDLKINADLKKAKLLIESPGIQIGGFEPIKLINQDFSLDYISTKNTLISLNQSDTVGLQADSIANKSNYDRIINSIFSESRTASINSRNNLNPDSLTTENDTIDLDTIKVAVSREDSLSNVSPIPDSLLITGIDSLYLQGPDSSIMRPQITQALPVEDKIELPQYRQRGISGQIDKIRIDSSVFDWKKNDDPNFPLRNTKFSIEVTELHLDTMTRFDVGRHIQDISLTVRDHEIKLPDSLNVLGVDKFTVSTGQRKVSAEGISLTSRVSKYDYASFIGHQVTWQNLEDLDVTIDSLDVTSFLNEQHINASKVTISGGHLDLFRDKEYPFPEDQRRSLPQTALRNLEPNITVDSVDIRDFSLEYRERQASDRPEGFITVDSINASFSRITNDSAMLRENRYVKAKAEGVLYDQGRLTLNINFDMIDPDDKFDWSLNFTSMPAEDFNQILEEAAYVSIASGNIKSINMTSQADKDYALGKMRFLYNDLKVSAINKRNMKTGGMGPGILSFFANTFVVKKNNPNARVFVRTGDIYFERDEKRIIFDYLVKTALNGVVASIGAGSNRKQLRKIKKEGKAKKDREKGRGKGSRKSKS